MAATMRTTAGTKERGRKARGPRLMRVRGDLTDTMELSVVRDGDRYRVVEGFRADAVATYTACAGGEDGVSTAARWALADALGLADNRALREVEIVGLCGSLDYPTELLMASFPDVVVAAVNGWRMATGSSDVPPARVVAQATGFAEPVVACALAEMVRKGW